MRHSLFTCFFALSIALPAVPQNNIDTRGELKAGDEQFEETGEFYDYYEVEMLAGQVLEVSMTSTEVNAYLIIEPPEGESIDHDDVPPIGSDAKMYYVALKTGTHGILATTGIPGESGQYEFKAQVMDSRRVDQRAGTLEKGDQINLKGGEYVDLITVKLDPGEKQLVSITTAGFDDYLSVHTPDGKMLLSDDPSAILMEGGEKGGEFKVAISSYQAGEVGDYVIEFRAILDRIQ